MAAKSVRVRELALQANLDFDEALVTLWDAGLDEFETINEVTFRDVATGLTIDVIPVEDDAQRWAFANATPEVVQGARPVRILTAEGLALMLLREATLGDARRRPLRLRDIETLAVNDDVDLGAVAPWVKRMGYEEAWRALQVEGKPAP